MTPVGSKRQRKNVAFEDRDMRQPALLKHLQHDFVGLCIAALHPEARCISNLGRKNDGFKAGVVSFYGWKGC